MKNKILRTAKYKRVSHDEQRLHGFSLGTQDEILNDFLKENKNLKLVAEFSDEGISAGTLKRQGLQDLLDLVRQDKIDLIIFTKLDRWFRSVPHYYKIQEILEEHNVAWQAVEEDYETITSGGKFKVNIMLSVAQNEIDRTSERIKTVFDYKIKNRQAVSGAQPLGYTTSPDKDGIKRVTKNKEQEKIVEFWIESFKMSHSKRRASAETNEEFDVEISYNSYSKIVTHEQYTGRYKGIDGYCEPYLTEEEQLYLQDITKNKHLRSNTRKVYLFTGLIRCPHCGRRLSGNSTRHKDREYNYYYRCGGNRINSLCDWTLAVSEETVEKYLLENIEKELDAYIVDAEIKEKEERNVDNKKKISNIKSEMKRLTNAYRKGRIEEDEYDAEYEELEEKLSKLEDVKPKKKKDYSELQLLLEEDFEGFYHSLTRDEQRALWRSIISEVKIDENKEIVGVVFA